MPCGGIHTYYDIGPGRCFLCGKDGADHFCEEWDCMLHAHCVVPFLDTDEGKCVIHHGHRVEIDFNPDWRKEAMEYLEEQKRKEGKK